jgi:hypothetical protein
MKKSILSTYAYFIISLILIQICCTPKSDLILDYVTQLKELHSLECEQLTKAGFDLKNKTSYEIHSAAFQVILKNSDRKILVHFELLLQDLAQKEFLMTDTEKNEFHVETEKMYTTGC